jgi:hypothetical protein
MSVIRISVISLETESSINRGRRPGSLDETAYRVAESLFDAAIGPDYDGDKFPVPSCLIQSCLAHFDTAFFVSHAFLVPFLKQLDTSIAAANGIYHGMSF